MGKVMADWLLDGDPGMDLWEMDVRRFGAHYRSPTYTLARVIENYSTYSDIRYPGQERTAGRPLRTSPAYPWQQERGAVFGEKGGWERVNYYAAHESLGDATRRPFGWAGLLWSPAIEAEHRATRQAVGLFDETSFAKIEVSGSGAADLLEHLCDNRVARGVGRITYTQMLNARGGVECDFTVTQVEDELFQIVTGTAFGVHDLSWIRRNAPRDGSVLVRDVTSAWTCFAVWGPRARDVLAPLTPQSLANTDFPYMSMRQTTVGGAPARLLRVTFVGELGWEVYVPTEHGSTVWSLLADRVASSGGLPCGYKAIDSLRAEKGYRYWGSDITADETPYQAGLGFCVRTDKTYVGSDALDPDPAERLACLTLADPLRAVLGNEPVRVAGRTVGRVTSGAIGHTIAASIAFAYLPTECTAPGTEVQVLVFGDWIDATVAVEPLYDPTGARVRG
jgi:4-methylaminobutanoate oxidase (formaldehyde-forming)